MASARGVGELVGLGECFAGETRAPRPRREMRDSERDGHRDGRHERARIAPQLGDILEHEREDACRDAQPSRGRRRWSPTSDRYTSSSVRSARRDAADTRAADERATRSGVRDASVSIALSIDPDAAIVSPALTENHGPSQRSADPSTSISDPAASEPLSQRRRRIIGSSVVLRTAMRSASSSASARLCVETSSARPCRRRSRMRSRICRALAGSRPEVGSSSSKIGGSCSSARASASRWRRPFDSAPARRAPDPTSRPAPAPQRRRDAGAADCRGAHR